VRLGGRLGEAVEERYLLGRDVGPGPGDEVRALRPLRRTVDRAGPALDDQAFGKALARRVQDAEPASRQIGSRDAERGKGVRIRQVDDRDEIDVVAA